MVNTDLYTEGCQIEAAEIAVNHDVPPRKEISWHLLAITETFTIWHDP